MKVFDIQLETRTLALLGIFFTFTTCKKGNGEDGPHYLNSSWQTRTVRTFYLDANHQVAKGDFENIGTPACMSVSQLNFGTHGNLHLTTEQRKSTGSFAGIQTCIEEGKVEKNLSYSVQKDTLKIQDGSDVRKGWFFSKDSLVITQSMSSPEYNRAILIAELFVRKKQ